jgi:hypothetical protein
MGNFRSSRPHLPSPQQVNLSLAAVREVIEDAIRPGHFFVGPSVDLEWIHLPKQEVSWELHRGRLLDPAQTRKRQVFEAWNVFLTDAGSRSAEPILSVKLDFEAKQLHVLRAVHCFVWEGYDAGDNVYLSRETTKWVREWMGTVELSSFHSAEELRDELVCQIFDAVVGAGRLALISMEVPLPAFSLGQLAYFYRSGLPPDSEVMRGFSELIGGALDPDLAWREKVKLLETVLRTANKQELEPAADLFVTRWRQIDKEANILTLLRGLFEEVSLTPYTDFVEKVLVFLDMLAQKGHITTEARVDFLSYLLRHISRHLTAYDLVTFHHRGANYPDALLLDAALKAYLQAIEDWTELFADVDSETTSVQNRKRIRRRALRQAWLLRRRYEGHPVPDVPTSPGENSRVLPPPHVRVPEEQIFDPSKRTKKLFAGDPLSPYLKEHDKEILRQSIADLRHPEELQEMGMALFLDRPLGVFKNPGEPDQTLLFSYEAFSRSVAERRLRLLAEDLELITNSRELAELRDLLEKLAIEGIPLEPSGGAPRPGAVSVADALKVADDFVFLRTTKKSLRDFLGLYRFEALAQKIALEYLTPNRPVLIRRSLAKSDDGALVIYDARKRERLELQIDPSRGYESRAGVEFLTAGLRVLRAWKEDGSPEQLNFGEKEQTIGVN